MPAPMPAPTPAPASTSTTPEQPLRTRSLTLTRAPGEAFDPAARTLPVIASTASVDDYGEVIDQASWNLGRFLKAPVALWQHCPWEDPVGFYRNVRVEGDALRADLVLYEGAADPLGRAEQTLARYAQGGPVSVSVGFRAGRIVEEERDGLKVRVLYDCELAEISVVTLGANPDAVAQRATRTKSAAARLRERRTKGVPMTFTEYLKERGMSPEECAAACSLSAAAVEALMAPGAAPSEEELAALVAGLGLAMDEVSAMFPKPAESEPAAEEEPVAKEDPAAEKALADEKALAAFARWALGALRVRSVAAAEAALETALAERDELRALARKAKGAAESQAKRSAEDERAKLLDAARRDGRLTPAREKLAAKHLAKLTAPADLADYLASLEPVLDLTERAAPPLAAEVSREAVALGAAFGHSPEQIHAAQKAAELRRLGNAQR